MDRGKEKNDMGNPFKSLFVQPIALQVCTISLKIINTSTFSTLLSKQNTQENKGELILNAIFFEKNQLPLQNNT